jgi:hypothetical protein
MRVAKVLALTSMMATTAHDPTDHTSEKTSRAVSMTSGTTATVRIRAVSTRRFAAAATAKDTRGKLANQTTA